MHIYLNWNICFTKWQQIW